MLTGDLVKVRFRKGNIFPAYIKTGDPELLNLARTLIDVFEQHVGSPRLELAEELKERLGTGTSFLIHRGLGKLLSDRCDFEADNDLEPVDLRERVFAAAAEAYQSHDLVIVDRDEILKNVARELGKKVEDVERQLYGDLKEAEVIQEFRTCTPEWLLQRYNVSLAQSVLLRATAMDLTVRGETPARYRELFRKLKFFQLLHEVKPVGTDGYRIHIDGPLSLFKSSQRYGLQMASMLPAILHAGDWSLEADIRWGAKRREGLLKLDAKTGLAPISRSTGQWQPEEVSWLEGQFSKLKTDWSVSTDGEIIDLGGEGILAPDFVFTHLPSGTVVHMEILGYWRSGSVDTRLELLRRHGPPNLILGISKELQAEDEDLIDLPGEVYIFRKTPVARDVHKLLNKMLDGETPELTLF